MNCLKKKFISIYFSNIYKLSESETQKSIWVAELYLIFVYEKCVIVQNKLEIQEKKIDQKSIKNRKV